MTLNLRKPLVYVARDIERALGMEPGRRGAAEYLVISNDTPYGRDIRAKYPDFVTLVSGLVDTFDLLSLPETIHGIASRKADVLVFQNTSRIERLAGLRGLSVINPPASLSKTIEEKVSQAKWLGEDARLLPPHRIMTLREVAFAGERFVLQFNHSHTGQGTHLIDSAESLEALRTKFPHRECRVTAYVSGPVLTVNAVVSGSNEGPDVLVGTPSAQITGLAPFTDLAFSTVGNDWDLPRTEALAAARAKTIEIALAVGARLRGSGWKGLFGVDTIVDEKSGATYLLEINARQPASATYESELARMADPSRPTIFEAHVAALQGDRLPQSFPEISGAQIIKRLTKTPYETDTAALRALGLRVIAYENSEPNAELFRIQSRTGIMEARDRLNSLGRSISSCIRKN